MLSFLSDEILTDNVSVRKEKTYHHFPHDNICSLGTRVNIGRTNRTRKQNKKKLTIRFCQNVRNSLIRNICMMNCQRSSNIIELRVSDIRNTEIPNEHPGYITFTNSKYKTSKTYGEKVIVLPKRLSNHLQYYVNELRIYLNPSSDTYLLVSTSNAQMSHSAIRSALTASFSTVGIFTKFEYTRVSPTHIRAHVQHLGAKRKVLTAEFLQSIL